VNYIYPAKITNKSKENLTEHLLVKLCPLNFHTCPTEGIGIFQGRGRGEGIL